LILKKLLPLESGFLSATPMQIFFYKSTFDLVYHNVG